MSVSVVEQTVVVDTGLESVSVITTAIQGPAGTGLMVREVSGSPIACTVLVFPNGSLTNLGGGVVQVTFGTSPPPPPPTGPALDFSIASNSMYVGAIL